MACTAPEPAPRLPVGNAAYPVIKEIRGLRHHRLIFTDCPPFCRPYH
jgi:hypothetical protein